MNVSSARIRTHDLLLAHESHQQPRVQRTLLKEQTSLLFFDEKMTRVFYATTVPRKLFFCLLLCRGPAGNERFWKRILLQSLEAIFPIRSLGAALRCNH